MSFKDSRTIINEIIPGINVDKELAPNEFIKKYYWDIYRSRYDDNRGINGRIFESLTAIILIRENILPFYMQAEVAFVPNVKYDFILYSNTEIISLSLKTSVRERYKQADLEAIALRYIHRAAKSYLVVLDVGEAEKLKSDMSKFIGINKVIIATDNEFSVLIDEIKKSSYTTAPKVEVVKSNSLITSENYKSILF